MNENAYIDAIGFKAGPSVDREAVEMRNGDFRDGLLRIKMVDFYPFYVSL